MGDLEQLKKHMLFKKQLFNVGEAVFICPFCEEKGLGEDRRGHLYYNLEKRTFFCQRCHSKGTIYDLAKRFKFHVNGNKLKKKEENSIISTIYQTLSDDKVKYLFSTFRRLKNEDKNEISYLVKRGLSIRDIIFYGWGKLKHYENFVVIPIIFNKKIVAFQGRSILSDTKKRYITLPSGVNIKHYLFQYDIAKYYSTIIITEGIFDVISAGLNTVATFGNYISNKQKEILINSNVKTIIFAFDKDTEEYSINSAMKFKDYIKNVGYVKWKDDLPEKADFNDIKLLYGEKKIYEILKKDVIYV